MEDTRNPVLVEVEVEVVKADGSSVNYKIKVPREVSLLETLILLQKQSDFTFKTEPSSWGPFLIEVNGERADPSEHRYWRITSNGEPVDKGLRDYIIKASQKIAFTNTAC